MQWAHKNTTVVSRSTSIVRTKKGEYLCDGNCGIAWRKMGYSFTAQNLKQMGMGVTEIMKATGLSEEEICQL